MKQITFLLLVLGIYTHAMEQLSPDEDGYDYEKFDTIIDTVLSVDEQPLSLQDKLKLRNLLPSALKKEKNKIDNEHNYLKNWRPLASPYILAKLKAKCSSCMWPMVYYTSDTTAQLARPFTRWITLPVPPDVTLDTPRKDFSFFLAYVPTRAHNGPLSCSEVRYLQRCAQMRYLYDRYTPMYKEQYLKKQQHHVDTIHQETINALTHALDIYITNVEAINSNSQQITIDGNNSQAMPNKLKKAAERNFHYYTQHCKRAFEQNLARLAEAKDTLATAIRAMPCQTECINFCDYQACLLDPTCIEGAKAWLARNITHDWRTLKKTSPAHTIRVRQIDMLEKHMHHLMINK